MADAPTTPAEFFDAGGVAPLANSVKAERRQQRKAEREVKQFRRTPKPIVARNENQTAYINSIHVNELTLAIGPAGVGKTYVPSRLFGEMLVSGQIDKIYVARPNVSKPKHRNGFLPGTMEEKTAPWLIPIFEGIRDGMGPADFDRFRREKKIEEVPFEFMQGRTFKNAAFIVDEAENLDMDDLYITLTRLGEDCYAVFCGDIYQARIHDSGLAQIVKMARDDDMESVGIVEFTFEDIVRSRQAKQWAKAFRAHWGHNNLPSAGICDTQVSETFHSGNTPAFLKET